MNPDAATMIPATHEAKANIPARMKNLPEAFGKLEDRRIEIPKKMKPSIWMSTIPQKNIAPE